MLPVTFLAAVLGLTLAAFVAHLLLRRRAAARLRRAGGEWGMHYAEQDRFRITPRVIERFPVPGASDFAVYDLLYRQDRDAYHYLFTVEFTVGVVRAKRRERRVGLLSEPRDAREGEGWSELKLAAAGLPRIEQYRTLLEALTAA